MGIGNFFDDVFGGIPLVGPIIGGTFKGLEALIEGPASPGTPEVTKAAELINQEQSLLIGTRSDIVRRNTIEQSSTSGTGADFIRRQQEGMPTNQGPIGEVASIASLLPPEPEVEVEPTTPFGGRSNSTRRRFGGRNFI